MEVHILAFVAMFTVCIACNNDQASRVEQGSLPKRAAPVFCGVDQQGNKFSSIELKGHPWIASFFFTSCQGVCPALNTVQAGLQKEFGNKVKFVSISTDPKSDSTDVLREYAKRFGARYGTWWMIRMPIDSVRYVATQGFALMDPQEPSMHSTRFAAVDANMDVVGYFDSEDSTDVQQLRTWISSLH